MQTSLRFRRHPRFPGVELIDFRDITNCPVLVTENLRVSIAVQETCRLRSRGSSWLAGTGDVAATEPGEVCHYESAAAPFHATTVFVEPRVLSRFTAEEPTLWHSGFASKNPVSSDRAFGRNLLALAAAIGDPASPILLIEECLLAFVTGLLRAFGGREGAAREASPHVAAVRRAIAMVHDRYAEPITLDELVEVARLPKTRFLRAFKRVVGLPPYAYQTHLRVDRARQMISRGAEISYVAAATGFCDQSHLHRHFVRIQGMTPGVYARNAAR